MTALPVVSGKQCVTALKKVGFEFARQRGSHIILVRQSPKTQVAVPNHNELDRGTLRGILRSAGITIDEFTDLL